MADAVRTIEPLPPLRLTVAEIAAFGDELAALVNSSGRVDTKYDVSFEDGTTFARDSSSDFLANLNSEGEPIEQVRLDFTAWTPLPPGEEYGGQIVKSVDIQLRNSGSQFYISSTDPTWGKGFVQTAKKRLGRHTPWYAGLLPWVPAVSGALTALPPLFILLAVLHEQRVTGLLVVVVVLSVLVFAGNLWFWREYMKRRFLAHTVIRREQPQHDWVWAKVIGAVATFAANIATLILLFVR
jgi:hypothetical protein